MKRILTLLLSLTLAFSVFVGSACNTGNGTQSTPNNTTSEDSTPEVSTPEEPPVLEFITRDDPVLAIETNVGEITLKDVYLLSQGQTEVAGKAFEGVVLGDFASTFLAEIIIVSYGSDGNWYITADPYNPTKFNPVTNAIFNYQIGSGKPLALSELELKLYGGQKLINVFGTQFGIYKLDEMLISMLPTTSQPFIQRMLQITVNDLYAISCGDYTYLESFIAETTSDEIINLAFDVASIMGVAFPLTQAVLVDLVEIDENGNLVVNENVKVADILDAVTEIAVYAEVTDTDVVFDEIINLIGKETTIAGLEEAVLSIEFDTLVDSAANLFKHFCPEESALIEETFATIKAKAEGALGELEVTEQQISVWFDDVISKIEGSYPEIALSLEALKELFADTLAENFADDLLNLEIDTIINSASDLLISLSPENESAINETKETLLVLFSGTVGNLTIDSKMEVGVLLNWLEEVLAQYVANEIIDAVFVMFDNLLGNTPLDCLMNNVLSISVDDLIDSLVEVIYTATNNDALFELEEVLTNLLDGTVGTPEYSQEYFDANSNKTLGELLGEDGNALTEIGLGALLQLSVGDIVSLVEGNPTSNALTILESISYADLLEIYNQQNQ